MWKSFFGEKNWHTCKFSSPFTSVIIIYIYISPLQFKYVIYFRRASCLINIYYECLKRQTLTTYGQILLAQLMMLLGDAWVVWNIPMFILWFLRLQFLSLHPFLISKGVELRHEERIWWCTNKKWEEPLVLVPRLMPCPHGDEFCCIRIHFVSYKHFVHTELVFWESETDMFETGSQSG